MPPRLSLNYSLSNTLLNALKANDIDPQIDSIDGATIDKQMIYVFPNCEIEWA